MPPRKRMDPVSRPASGVRPWDQIANRDPERHYVWVNPNEQHTGTEYYASLGYDFESYRKDGPQPKVTRTLKDGDQITCLGQVLMSCPISHRQQMDAEGIASVEALEKRILRPGGVDALRGFGPGTKVVNETTDNFSEQGL